MISRSPQNSGNMVHYGRGVFDKLISIGRTIKLIIKALLLYKSHNTCRQDNNKTTKTILPDRMISNNIILRAWCKTIVTTIFYKTSYNSFALNSRFTGYRVSKKYSTIIKAMKNE